MITLRKIAVTLLKRVGLSREQDAAGSNKSPADKMAALRRQALSSSPEKLGLIPTQEFPRVYGVLIEFPVAEVTVTIVSFCDGSASLYSTSSFGVIGGGSHDAVAAAAVRLVAAADPFFDEASPTTTYPYPAMGKVRFYFVSFEGVRVAEADFAAVEADQSPYSKLFWVGQEVMAQLRLIVQGR